MGILIDVDGEGREDPSPRLSPEYRGEALLVSNEPSI
jgi:hypothetical protein